MLSELAAWLGATAASRNLRDAFWVVPAIQTVHILAIAALISSIAMIDLRILGFAGRRQSMTETVKRHAPWIWAALVVLAISGTILITAEPDRSLINVFFQLKMLLLVLAIAVTVALLLVVSHREMASGPATPRAVIAKSLAIAAFLFWSAIAVAGRWIAYA